MTFLHLTQKNKSREETLLAEIERLTEHVATLQELRELDRKLIAKLRAEIELVSK